MNRLIEFLFLIAPPWPGELGYFRRCVRRLWRGPA
jgi:hypothetical protein